MTSINAAEPTLVTGGNVTSFETHLVQAAPRPVIDKKAIRHLVYASVATATYATIAYLLNLHLTPQPYLTGNTFHGITAFPFNPVMIAAPILGTLMFTWLGISIWNVREKTRFDGWTRGGDIAVVNFAGLLFLPMILLFAALVPLSASDVSNPNDTWIVNTLHIDNMHLPAKAGSITVKNTRDETLTFRYIPTPGRYTLTLLNTVAKTTAASIPTLQLPGTNGTVHTTDDKGNPLTYTYTKDAKGHYTITIKP